VAKQTRQVYREKRDNETNNDYFDSRYFDSDLGRWLSVEPLADKYPGWSPYNYMKNFQYVSLIVIAYFQVVILFLSSCSSSSTTSTHEFEIIELKEYFDGKGAIVPSTSMDYFTFGNDSTKFTPTIDQIKIAESILLRDIYYNKIIFDDRNLIIKNKEDSLVLINKYVKEFESWIRDYYRYYIGYKNNSNEDIILIHLFNFNTSEAREIFSEWQDKHILGVGGFFEENMRWFRINLNNQEIEND